MVVVMMIARRAHTATHARWQMTALVKDRPGGEKVIFIFIFVIVVVVIVIIVVVVVVMAGIIAFIVIRAEEFLLLVGGIHVHGVQNRFGRCDNGWVGVGSEVAPGVGGHGSSRGGG